MIKIEEEISVFIIKNKQQIAEKIVLRQYELYPELLKKYGASGKDKCLRDITFHLSYLAESISDSTPEIFLDYIIWAKFMLDARNIPLEDLINTLILFKAVFKNIFTQDMYIYLEKYIELALIKLKLEKIEPICFIDDTQPYAEITRNYLNALLNGERNKANQIIVECVNSNIPIKDIYLHIFQKSQYEIGRLWQLNKISVAHEHYATAATQLIMSQLYPYIFSSEKNGLNFLATCIEDDFHELGIRMLADFFEMDGWNTFYLGANTPISSIISTIIEREIDLVAISITISYNLKKVKDLIKAIRLSNRAKKVKIMVGGYPFNLSDSLWIEVGADASAKNAQDALLIAMQLVNNNE